MAVIIVVVIIAGTVAGALTFNRLFIGARRGRVSEGVRERRRQHPLDDDFRLSDLPFGAFETCPPRIADRLQGESPYGGRVWTFHNELPSASTTYTFTTALIEVPNIWPYLGVERRSNSWGFYGIASAPALPSLGDDAADRRYVARADDHAFATTFLGDEVRHWLVEHREVLFFEIDCGLLVASVHGKHDPGQMADLLTWVIRLLERTPIGIWPSGERRVRNTWPAAPGLGGTPAR